MSYLHDLAAKARDYRRAAFEAVTLGRNWRRRARHLTASWLLTQVHAQPEWHAARTIDAEVRAARAEEHTRMEAARAMMRERLAALRKRDREEGGSDV